VRWARRRQQELGRTRTRWRLVTGNVLVLAMLLSTLFAGLEVYYRYVYDQTDSWGLARAGRRWFERHVHLNNAGVRDDGDYRYQRTAGRRRVTFVGDSFTAGHGVRDVKRRFANLVRAERPRWEVHCLAVPGFDTPQTIEQLDRLRREGYELDVVVLVYCLNDIGQVVPESFELLPRLYADLENEGFLLRSSYAVNTLYYRYRWRADPALDDYFGYTRRHYSGEPWRKQRIALDTLRNSVEEAPGNLMVVTFPFLHRLDGEYGFDDAHRALGDHWRQRGVPHLDLLPTFRRQSSADVTVNRWDAHPNERAHRMAADALLEFLTAHVGPQ
jgi:hypothetical protein